MNFSALIPVADIQSAKSSLEAAGYGPDNFSVPVYTNRPAPAYATLHAWGNNLADFYAAVKALPNVVWSETGGTPQDVVNDALSGVSGKWGGNAQPLAGQVTAGNLYKDADGGMWWVIQPYDADVFSDPTVIPALVRRARIPSAVGPWVQPIDQFDAYKLVNPFTGQPDQVEHNGEVWTVTGADGSGNNIWEPGVFGWTGDQGGTSAAEPPSEGPAPWVQPTGAQDAYPLGATVTHNGQTWENTGSPANVWAPGVFGWTVV
jgi:hypothetical protein